MWTYKDEWYEPKPINWNKVYTSGMTLRQYLELKFPKYATQSYAGIYFAPIVYDTLTDKCFSIERFGKMGNGNHLKMCVQDLYSKKIYYTSNINRYQIVVRCL